MTGLGRAADESVEAYVDGFRERYRSGATRVRLVRPYDPDGGVRLVDFGAEFEEAVTCSGAPRRA